MRRLCGDDRIMSFQKFLEKIDLGKRFPDYFHKWIFRFVIGIIFILLGFATIWFMSNGLSFVNISCPADSISPCKNVLYDCKSEGTCNNFDEAKHCIKGLCDTEYLAPGQSLGILPPPYIQHFKLIVFLLVLGGFFLNHMWWVMTK